MIKLSSENSFPFPYLFDGDQSSSKKYDAICTPDFLDLTLVWVYSTEVD